MEVVRPMLRVSLANFGIDVAFVTKVPDNPIGQAAINDLRRFGVDTGIYCERRRTIRDLLFGKRRFPETVESGL